MEGRMKPLRAAAAFAVLAGAPALAGDSVVGGPPRPPLEAALLFKLAARVDAVDAGLDGVLGVAIKDLSTGATISLRPDLVFPQASSIKLAVLYELFHQAGEGRLDLAEVTAPDARRVAGDGVLYLLGPQVRLTWRDLAVLMMALSDNEAANLLIERVGMAAVNARLDGLGLGATRLRRLMMDVEAAGRGEENVSTPAQMLRLLEAMRAGTGLSEAGRRDMLALASLPKESPFRSVLPPGLTVADKPGDLEGVRCVSALVELPRRPYAAAVMATHLRRDADGEAAIRDLSTALLETFDRLDRASALGRIVSDR
jgi:beta-lactamase class A